MSIQHMSYVACDRCWTPAPLGESAPEARAIASNLGWEYRSWNKRLRDVCPDCKTRSRTGETSS